MNSTRPVYSVPDEARSVFYNGIIKNPLMAHLPPELHSLAALVKFEGNELPSMPVNWRWAESISALKALEASMVNLLLVRKYGMEPVEIKIDTDHASLCIFNIALASIVSQKEAKFSFNVSRPAESLQSMFATGLYPTRDKRFYHIHGSFNATATLEALGLSLQGEEGDTFEQVVKRIGERVSSFDADRLDELLNDEKRQAGTVVRSSDEYFASEQGQQSGKIGLYELHRHADSSQPPSWWPDSASLPSSPQRPLAGLKVVDLTRVIAGPTMTKNLAELGASIMRVTSPHLPDFANAFHDLNWGKWNCHLHLTDERNRERLRELIREADVVVDGYRPGVMDRLGFGRDAIFDLVRHRDRGIVHLRENCYGWHGPWSHRSGWQGISDACTGVSLAYGRAMGIDEPVTPPFPNSDSCTGTIGSTAVIHALLQRAEHGGSYGVDAALNYYSQWLVRSCGTYPPEVWHHLWTRHASPVFRHFDNTRRTVPALTSMLHKHDAHTLLQPRFFHQCYSETVGATVRKVKPVAVYGDGVVELGYNVGTRGNGVDDARWPDDLMVAVVEEV